MNGPHDLGGQMGFGPVRPEKDEPWFHGEWEKRALAVTLAMGATGQWNIDASRHARESLHPQDYLAKSYYDVWISALEKLMQMRGLATEAELREGRMMTPPKSGVVALRGEATAAALARGGPTKRSSDAKPRFTVGDAVRTKNINPTGHTRLPRYARGKTGVVEIVHGAFVFADSNARFDGENPQWLYTVTFTGPELWGEGTDAKLSVSIDAWESYLEPA